MEELNLDKVDCCDGFWQGDTTIAATRGKRKAEYVAEHRCRDCVLQEGKKIGMAEEYMSAKFNETK